MPDFRPFNMQNSWGAGKTARQNDEYNALRMDATRQSMQYGKEDRAAAQQANDEAQTRKGLEWLAGSTGYAMKNPDAIPKLIESGKRQGFIDQNFDPAGMDPAELMQKIQQLHHGAIVELGNKMTQTDSGLPNEAQEFEYYRSLDPEAQKAYLARKRSQPGLNFQLVPQSDGSQRAALIDMEGGAAYDLSTGRQINSSPQGYAPPGMPSPQQQAPQQQAPQQQAPQQQAPQQSPSFGVSQTPADKVAGELETKRIAEERAGAISKYSDRAALFSRLTEFVEHPSANASGGFIQGALPTFSQGAHDARVLRQSAADMMSLSARSKMKGSGQISDFESKLLARAATILNDLRISDELAINEANMILQQLAEGGAQQAPPEALDYLKKNPSTSGKFLEKFGYLPAWAYLPPD